MVHRTSLSLQTDNRICIKWCEFYLKKELAVKQRTLEESEKSDRDVPRPCLGGIGGTEGGSKMTPFRR